MSETASRADRLKYPQELYEAFSNTSHGQKLAGEARYWPYVEGHISRNAWRDLAGADVNNLEHMDYTLSLTDLYIRTSQRLKPDIFTEEQERQLRIAAAIHDCGEALGGDILLPLKTAGDEVAEQAAYHQYLEEFFPGRSPEDYDELRTIVDTIIFGKDNDLAKHFNAIENLGYMQTALKLYGRHAHNPTSIKSDALKRGVISAAASPFESSIKRTADYYEDTNFPAVKHFIDNRASLILEAMSKRRLLRKATDFFGPKDDMDEAEKQARIALVLQKKRNLAKAAVFWRQKLAPTISTQYKESA